MDTVFMDDPYEISKIMLVNSYILLWNIVKYRLYDLPRTAHTKLLNHIAGVPDVNHSLKCSN